MSIEQKITDYNKKRAIKEYEKFYDDIRRLLESIPVDYNDKSEKIIRPIQKILYDYRNHIIEAYADRYDAEFFNNLKNIFNLIDKE